MSTQIKRYSSLDIMKFISAILIIVLHTSPFSSYSKVLSFGFRNIITIVAVPFFFCTSGFLLFKKLSLLDQYEGEKYLKKYIWRLCLMYGLWSLVYLPFVIYGWLKDGQISLDEIVQYIKYFFFEGSYSTIWFLPALIIAALICYLLHRRYSFDRVFLIAVPFYVLACLMTNYYGITETIPILKEFMQNYYNFFDSVKNGILFGFIFVALGGLFAESQGRKKNIVLIFGAGIATLGLAIESVLFLIFDFKQFGCDTKIFLIPFTMFLFSFLLQFDIKSNKIYIYLQKISLLLFLSQRIFISLANIFLAQTIWVKNSLLYFVMILGLTWLFSDLFIRVSKKVHFLRYFC